MCLVSKCASLFGCLLKCYQNCPMDGEASTSSSKDKKTKKNVKPGSTSSQILEYYKNYSQNRDLPKYFRSSDSLKIDEWKKPTTKESQSELAIPTVVVTEQIEPHEIPPYPITCPPSPASSVASNRRLEWDNGADIGYGNASKNLLNLQKSLSLPVLNTIEREKLQNTLLRRSPEGNSRDFVQVRRTNVTSSSSSTSGSSLVGKDRGSSSSSSTTTHSHRKLKSISGVSPLPSSSSNTVSENDLARTKYGVPMAESTPIFLILNQSSSDPETYLETPKFIPCDVKHPKRRTFQSILREGISSDGAASALYIKEKSGVVPPVEKLKLSISKPISVECGKMEHLKNKLVQTSLPRNASVGLQTDLSLKRTRKSPLNPNFESNSEDNLPVSGTLADLTSVSRCTSFEYLSGLDYNRIEEVSQQREEISPQQPVAAEVVSENASTLPSSSNSKDSPLADLLTANLSKQNLKDLQTNLELLQKVMKSKKYNEVTKKYYLKKITQKMIGISGSLNKDSQTKSSSEMSSTSDSKKSDIKAKTSLKTLKKQTFTNEICPEDVPEKEISNDGDDMPKSSKLPRSHFLTLTKPESNNSSGHDDAGGGGDTIGLSNPNHLEHSSSEALPTTSSSSRSTENWRDSVTRSEKLREQMKEKRISESNSYLVDYAKKERNTQLNWIKNEISHLSKIKKLLEKKDSKKNSRPGSVLEEVLKKPIIENIKGTSEATTVYVLTTHKDRLARPSSNQDEAIPPRNTRRTCLDGQSYVNIANDTPDEINSRVFATNSGRTSIRRYTIEIPAIVEDDDDNDNVEKVYKPTCRCKCNCCCKNLKKSTTSSTRRSSSPPSSRSGASDLPVLTSKDIKKLTHQLVCVDDFVVQHGDAYTCCKCLPLKTRETKKCNCTCKCKNQACTLKKSKSPSHRSSSSRSPSPPCHKVEQEENSKKATFSHHLVTSEHFFGGWGNPKQVKEKSSQTVTKKPRLSIHHSSSEFCGGLWTTHSPSPSRNVRQNRLSQHLVTAEHFISRPKSRTPSPKNRRNIRHLSCQLVSSEQFLPDITSCQCNAGDSCKCDSRKSSVVRSSRLTSPKAHISRRPGIISQRSSSGKDSHHSCSCSRCRNSRRTTSPHLSPCRNSSHVSSPEKKPLPTTSGCKCCRCTSRPESPSKKSHVVETCGKASCASQCRCAVSSQRNSSGTSPSRNVAGNGSPSRKAHEYVSPYRYSPQTRSPNRNSPQAGSPNRNCQSRSPTRNSPQTGSPSRNCQSRSSTRNSPQTGSSCRNCQCRSPTRNSQTGSPCRNCQSRSPTRNAQIGLPCRNCQSRSPTRNSPQTESPCRNSPQTRSPCRNSPQTRSPSGNSPQTRSPRRNSQTRSPRRNSPQTRSPCRNSSQIRSPSRNSLIHVSPSRNSPRVRSPYAMSPCRKSSSAVLPDRNSFQSRSPGRNSPKSASPGRYSSQTKQPGRNCTCATLSCKNCSQNKSPNRNIRSPYKNSSRAVSPGKYYSPPRKVDSLSKSSSRSRTPSPKSQMRVVHYSRPRSKKSTVKSVCCCQHHICPCRQRSENVQTDITMAPHDIQENYQCPSSSSMLQNKPCSCCNCCACNNNNQRQPIPSTTSQPVPSTTSSVPSSSSSEEAVCQCCKRMCSIPRESSTSFQQYLLCNMCLSKTPPTCDPPPFLYPGHKCNCYDQARIMQEIRDTLEELDKLKDCEEDDSYCKCEENCPKCMYFPKSNSDICACCNCKIFNKYNVAKGGLAYLLTVESDEKMNVSSEQEKTMPFLKEVKVKVPGRPWRKCSCSRNICECQAEGKSFKKHGRHKGKHYRSATLQEYLCFNRPSFIISAEERRRALIELAYMREERCQKYKQILALTDSKQLPHYSRKRYYLFSSDEMKGITARNYKKLPEVQQRLSNNREKRIKRANLILADIFNKNVRKETLKGNVNFSTHASIIKLV